MTRFRFLAFSAMLCATGMAGDLSNRRAPSFALPDSTGKYYDILDYRGKILVLDIMQTNCPHCATLAGTLERVKAKYAGKINVLSIVNPPDNAQTVSQFVAKHRISSPILFDFGQTSAIYFKATPQNTTINLPHLFVIDAKGQIRDDFAYSDATKYIFEGKGLDAVLDKLLAGK